MQPGVAVQTTRRCRTCDPARARRRPGVAVHAGHAGYTLSGFHMQGRHLERSRVRRICLDLQKKAPAHKRVSQRR